METPHREKQSGLDIPVPAIDPISGPVTIPRPPEPLTGGEVQEEPDDDPQKAG